MFEAIHIQLKEEIKMTNIIIIQKDDKKTSKNEEDYMRRTKEGIGLNTVNVNPNRSKGRTHIVIRPRSIPDIIADITAVHEEVHADKEKVCFDDCRASQRIQHEIDELNDKLKIETNRDFVVKEGHSFNQKKYTDWVTNQDKLIRSIQNNIESKVKEMKCRR
jgi:hypothetical protein